jgi:endo-1,4-beta-xylanase
MLSRSPIQFFKRLICVIAVSGVMSAHVSLIAAESAPNSLPQVQGATPVILVSKDIDQFKPAIYTADKTDGRVEVVTVKDKEFTTALRLTTVKPAPSSWLLGANAKTLAPVRKGDVLWVSFQSRRVTSLKETGEAIAEVTFMQKKPAGGEVRPLENGFTTNIEWRTTSIPFVAKEDSEAGMATLAIRFGGAIQSLEVADLVVVNYGSNVNVTDLPRTAASYEGSAPDAKWRQDALARIEQIRKGDLPVRVIDAAGRPVTDAEVSVRMKRHAFSWGAQIDGKQIWDERDPNTVKVRSVVETYFNKVVYGNDMKWGRWIVPGKEWGREHALNALPWLNERNIAVRGHVMVWPSWRYVPKSLRELESNPDAVKKAIFDNIDDQTAAIRAANTHLAEWDVVNETFAHHNVLDLFGKEIMVDWFKRAKAGAPKTALFYNDYTMFQGTSANSPSQHFFDTIKFLKDKGAPIDAIGEQAHFGSTPAGPPQILATLDKFATFGLPIQFTEFDIDTPDLELQKNFMRDLTITAFSHPSVMGVVHWGIWEGNRGKDYSPNAALWALDWTLRPHGQVWLDLVTKTWWTNADGRTNADGTYQTRGFYGDYDVTVKKGGKSQTVRVKLRQGEAIPVITL